MKEDKRKVAPEHILQDVAEHQSTACFVEDYIRDNNGEERQELGLGIAIAQWTEWDGLKIMRVFRAALEDANFHEEASVVDGLMEKYERESEEETCPSTLPAPGVS